jgi:hypothetical protein
MITKVVRPALSPALTKLARELQAETPGFAPLKPGEHRSIDDYTVNHYFEKFTFPKFRFPMLMKR